MLSDVIDIIQNQLEGDYFDVKAGLVYPIEIQIEGKRKKYPFRLEPVDICESEAVTPDSSKMSVMYFEEMTDLKSLGRKMNSVFYTTEVRLVFWVNKNKTGNVSTGSIAQNLINQISKIEPFNSGIYSAISPAVICQEQRNEKVFTKYGYNALPYMVKPYDFFSLRLQITYNSGCESAINITGC